MTNGNKFEEKCTKEYLTEKICGDFLDRYRYLRQDIFRGKSDGTLELGIIDLGDALDRIIDDLELEYPPMDAWRDRIVRVIDTKTLLERFLSAYDPSLVTRLTRILWGDIAKHKGRGIRDITNAQLTYLKEFHAGIDCDFRLVLEIIMFSYIEKSPEEIARCLHVHPMLVNMIVTAVELFLTQ